MRLANKRVAEDLKAGRALRLDLGCGSKPKAGFYGLDLLAGSDVVADLNEPLDLLPDSCAEHVFASHSLEHVERLVPLVAELHRILQPGALLEVIAPHFSNPYFYSDPTHVRPFGLYTMSYFVDEGSQRGHHKVPPLAGAPRFMLERVSFSFYRSSLCDRIVVPLIRGFANASPWSQDTYERRLSWIFPAAEVRYRMHALKP